MRETRFVSGMLVFPDLTQLDLTGPYEVLAGLPGAETLLLWKSLEPVRSHHGLTLLPMATLSSCPPLDLVLVPGGAGINPLLEDSEVLAFPGRAAAQARYVVGVCTGSLVLGAAGLLRGRRATTHWIVDQQGSVTLAPRLFSSSPLRSGRAAPFAHCGATHTHPDSPEDEGASRIERLVHNLKLGR